eukprot:GEMP01073283.1.p1 GENE.GEMP01073283.1~~GEMP01073283.1.p1  ORF type:complete len:217 (-),score=33.34 GEMP01073283.1:534-1163(-)
MRFIVHTVLLARVAAATLDEASANLSESWNDYYKLHAAHAKMKECRDAMQTAFDNASDTEKNARKKFDDAVAKENEEREKVELYSQLAEDAQRKFGVKVKPKYLTSEAQKSLNSAVVQRVSAEEYLKHADAVMKKAERELVISEESVNTQNKLLTALKSRLKDARSTARAHSIAPKSKHVTGEQESENVKKKYNKAPTKAPRRQLRGSK